MVATAETTELTRPARVQPRRHDRKSGLRRVGVVRPDARSGGRRRSRGGEIRPANAALRGTHRAPGDPDRRQRFGTARPRTAR